VKFFLNILDKFFDERLAPKYLSGDRILFTCGSDNFRSDRRVIYCVHLNGLYVPAVVNENINYFFNNKYDVILVLSYSGLNLESVIQLVKGLSSKCKIIVRSNIGKDFIAFADVYNAMDLSGVEFLVFQNDSMIGPLYSSNFISKVEAVEGDYVGLTESHEPSYHIQSSFLMFKGYRSIQLVGDFFKNRYKIYKNRDNIVKYGEVGLSSYMIENGISIGVYLPVSRLLSSCEFSQSIATCNSQHHLGIEMLVNYDLPYIKRELVSRNPAGVPIHWSKISSKINVRGMSLLLDSLRSRL
jgi:hypothetical protein